MRQRGRMAPPMSLLSGAIYIGYHTMLAIKACLAAIGGAIVAVHPGESAPVSARTRRLDVLLLAVALVAVASWPNFGALRGPNRPIYLHDFFHYYIGAKYFGELGYTRIYQCTAVAEIDEGRLIDVARRWQTDLHTDAPIVHAPTASEQAECRDRFGDRWSTFRSDIEWFRSHMRPTEWKGVQTDLGFNATPTWAAVGHWLAGRGPISDASATSLAALDYGLLASMCVIIWRTFGQRTCCVAALWWALSEPTSFFWLGGAFLRHDALFLIVAATCALKRGWWGVAGISLAAAVFLRAYPALILAGVAIHVVNRVRVDGFGGLDSRYRSLVAGLAGGAVLLVALTQITWDQRGITATEPWRAFVANSSKHLSTPSTGTIGLRTLLSFSEASRTANVERFWLDEPWDTWRAARTRVFESRRWVYWALVLPFLILFTVAARKTPAWVALVLGVALLPIVANLNSYYYSVLLVFAFLWPADRLIGVALAALSAFTNVLPFVLTVRDDRTVAMSAAFVLFSTWVVLRANSARVSARLLAPATAEARST